ncbi:MAG: ribonuclease P protein component [Lachnospiraceae bacterium]|nr:ribonuclease P protein component [Lachnospiraceae bacterium]
MRNIPSLKTYRDFQEVYSARRSCANRYLILYKKEVDDPEKNARIGISVSKKVGNSIIRHRITRLIRESYRLNRDRMKEGSDIIVVARPEARDLGFKEIEEAYLHLLKKQELLNV